MKVTLPDLREVVAEDNKQRYSLILATATASTSLQEPSISALSITETEADKPNPEVGFDYDDPAQFLIRANQGHSIVLASEELLEPIKDENLPGSVVHGTTRKAWNLILQTGGLRRMRRNHIHFASGLPKGFTALEGDDDGEIGEEEPEGMIEKEQPPVISGMRNSSSILIYIDLPKAIASGLKFWLSENGVVLTEGDESGFLRTEYFKRVEDRKTREVLLRDGLLVDGVRVQGKGKGRAGPAGA